MGSARIDATIDITELKIRYADQRDGQQSVMTGWELILELKDLLRRVSELEQKVLVLEQKGR